MGLFQFLQTSGDVIGGGIGDFAAKTGEMVGKGVKGLRTGKVEPLSYSTPQFVGSGLSAGAQAYGLASAGGALNPVKRPITQLPGSTMRANLSPMREGAEKALGRFDEALQALNNTSEETKAILNGIKNPHTLRELADLSQFISNVLPK